MIFGCGLFEGYFLYKHIADSVLPAAYRGFGARRAKRQASSDCPGQQTGNGHPFRVSEHVQSSLCPWWSSAEYDEFEIGDKIVAVSASFGDEIWDADSYGQVIYAMKNRNGDIYLKMKKMGGDLSALEQNEKSTAMAAERAGGNYGAGTKEQQMQNFSKKKELEVQRLDMFDEGIALYNKDDFDGALIVFEEVAALEPKNYMSDSFEMATEIYRVSEYNIACCFSKLGQVDNSLQALKKCMGAGWTDYKKIRSDPSLANAQQAPGFKEMMDKFDEPLLNDNAVKFLKGIFGK